MRLQKSEGGNFEQTPAGTFTAICYRFIDLGSHEQSFQGETKIKHFVMIGFELPNELMSDGRPFTIHKRYTWSMHEKATLRKDLESWRGRRFTDADFGDDGFDTRNLLGVPATITITHSENEGRAYSNISSIGGIMKGLEKPTPINMPVYLALVKGEFDQSIFDSLSDNLKETISKTPEYAALNVGHKITNAYAAQKGKEFSDYDEVTPPPHGEHINNLEADIPF